VVATRDEFITKDDLEKSLVKFKEEIIHEFHMVIEGLTDLMKLLAEGQSGLVERLDRVETRLDHMEKEKERRSIETRGLIKSLFPNSTTSFPVWSNRSRNFGNGENRSWIGFKFNPQSESQSSSVSHIPSRNEPFL